MSTEEEKIFLQKNRKKLNIRHFVLENLPKKQKKRKEKAVFFAEKEAFKRKGGNYGK